VNCRAIVKSPSGREQSEMSKLQAQPSRLRVWTASRRSKRPGGETPHEPAGVDARAMAE
jgi:hypothetical protein